MIDEWIYAIGFLELSAMMFLLALALDRKVERLEKELLKLSEGMRKEEAKRE
jgi:hypothetical protein